LDNERFERDGYLIVEAITCPISTLDGVVSDLEDLYAKEPKLNREVDGVSYAYRRIQDAWKVSENVKALALDPIVLRLLEKLYGRRPLPFQTLNFRVGSQQPAHSDAIHFNSQPAGFMCGVWVALEDIDMDNGPVVYYPGSQKRRELTPADLGIDATFDEYRRYTDHIAGLIDAGELGEPHYATLKKGQALIWASNILHGGSRQRDLNRTRHSQVTHYFFEGCRYYTPMKSDEKQVEWLNPTWIT
jgi:ectoine hydroxylase-related dioxygenase (phytanoyl-CoA dioxygenase family)